MADMIHIYCEATDQHAWMPADSISAWATVGWRAMEEAVVEDDDQDSVAEADETAGTSRGKPTAKTTKDK